MTLELKRYKDEFFNNSDKPYQLYGIQSVSNCGYGRFSITISDTRIFPIHCFEYVKIVDNGMTIIKDGEWCYDND